MACILTTLLLTTVCIVSISVVATDADQARDEVLARVKRQDISDKCNLADIIFVLDSSDSIGLDNWVKVLDFTKSIAGGFVIGPEEVQIGVSTYGNRARVVFNLNQYDNGGDVNQAIENIQWQGGNTNTSGGIRLMNEVMFTLENGKRQEAPALGIVITYGPSTRDIELTIPTANAARANGIVIFAIGITDQADPVELNGIATDHYAKFVFQVADFNDLAAIRDEVANAVCQDASDLDACTGVFCGNRRTCMDLTNPLYCSCTAQNWRGGYCTTNVDICTSVECANGGTCMDLENRFFCKCTEDWRGVYCTENVSDKCNLADIIFVLDSSGSIGSIDNWNNVLNFIKRIAGGFIIGPEEVQIGVSIYGNRARVIFNLNEYDNGGDVNQAIENIQWQEGNTNTSGGIRLMNEVMFTPENGKRQRAPALGIVITDGPSTRDVELTIPTADAARANGIVIFAIGITDQVDPVELNGIANDPDESFVFQIADFNDLAAIRDEVVHAVCQAASDPDDCIGVECANGGTCMDLEYRFFCKCTEDWRGVYCTEKIFGDPAVSLVEPDVGPIAGKTRITLVGENFIPGLLVTLGPELFTDFISSTRHEAVVTTPRVDPSFTGETLPISIEFPGFERINTTFTFTYLANPTMESVRPNITNVVGGTTLTVRGKHLNSIQDPVLKVTMVHVYVSSGERNEEIYNSSCDVESGNTMFCWTPKIDLPEAFKGWDQGGNRRRRAAGLDSVEQEPDLTLTTGDQTLDFYIGFKLDGVETYKNLSATEDLFLYGKLSYVSTRPTISADNDFDTFIPYTGATISIKGAGLTGGFQPSDYKVGIGASWCNGLEMTQNRIVCVPPDKLPDKKQNQLRTNDETTERAVTVHIGRNLDFHAGYLTYDITEKSNLTTSIIAVTITCVVALAVVLGMVIFRLKRRRNSDQSSSLEMRNPSLGKGTDSGRC